MSAVRYDSYSMYHEAYQIVLHILGFVVLFMGIILFILEGDETSKSKARLVSRYNRCMCCVAEEPGVRRLLNEKVEPINNDCSTEEDESLTEGRGELEINGKATDGMDGSVAIKIKDKNVAGSPSSKKKKSKNGPSSTDNESYVHELV